MKIPRIQNLVLLGNIKEREVERQHLFGMFERIAAFAKKEYEKDPIPIASAYFRISRNSSKFLVIISKENAKENPYFAILDIKNKEHPVRFAADVETLLPLLAPGIEKEIKLAVSDSMTVARGLTSANNYISDYITDYDAGNREGYEDCIIDR